MPIGYTAIGIFLYVTGSPVPHARRCAGIFRLISCSKWGFHPARATSTNAIFGSTPGAKFRVYRCRNVRLKPSKLF